MRVGDVVGNYRVTGELASGGMSSVYLGQHTGNGREAAIKVLRLALSKNEELIAALFSDAKATTAIRHPGIVEVHDFGYAKDGSAYLAMERLAGESLNARLERETYLPVERALSIARQVAVALHAAHQHGIIHRDLKPNNIHLLPDPHVPGGERVKVLDFGMARLRDREGYPAMDNQEGTVMGAPAYMAPEQFANAERVDHRADQYALGCILFHMVCGRAPFEGKSHGVVMAQQAREPPPVPILIQPSISRDLNGLILRLLEKDPKKRFPDTFAVLTRLHEVSGLPTPAAGRPLASPGPDAPPDAVPGGQYPTLSGVVSSARRTLALGPRYGDKTEPPPPSSSPSPRPSGPVTHNGLVPSAVLAIEAKLAGKPWSRPKLSPPQATEDDESPFSARADDPPEPSPPARAQRPPPAAVHTGPSVPAGAVPPRHPAAAPTKGAARESRSPPVGVPRGQPPQPGATQPQVAGMSVLPTAPPPGLAPRLGPPLAPAGGPSSTGPLLPLGPRLPAAGGPSSTGPLLPLGPRFPAAGGPLPAGPAQTLSPPPPAAAGTLFSPGPPSPAGHPAAAGPPPSALPFLPGPPGGPVAGGPPPPAPPFAAAPFPPPAGQVPNMQPGAGKYVPTAAMETSSVFPIPPPLPGPEAAPRGALHAPPHRRADPSRGARARLAALIVGLALTAGGLAAFIAARASTDRERARQVAASAADGQEAPSTASKEEAGPAVPAPPGPAVPAPPGPAVPALPGAGAKPESAAAEVKPSAGPVATALAEARAAPPSLPAVTAQAASEGKSAAAAEATEEARPARASEPKPEPEPAAETPTRAVPKATAQVRPEGAPESKKPASEEATVPPAPPPAPVEVEDKETNRRPTALITLQVDSLPHGAVVIRQVDGVRLGETPFTYQTEPQKSSVAFILRHKGYRDEVVTLPGNRSAERRVPLTRSEGPDRAPSLED